MQALHSRNQVGVLGAVHAPTGVNPKPLALMEGRSAIAAGANLCLGPGFVEGSKTLNCCRVASEEMHLKQRLNDFGGGNPRQSFRLEHRAELDVPAERREKRDACKKFRLR